MAEENEKLSTKREVDWICVVFNLQIYVSCLCGLHFIIYDAYLSTTIFGFALVLLGYLGTTAGSHRLWTHRSYQATTTLKIFLMLCQTIGSHTSIYNWVRLHRFHHKHFGTDLDPYNPRKGFVYSHFLANNLKLSPAQEKLLEEIDMSDIESDKIVMFQKKFYWVLYAIVALLLPINAPVEYWDESILNSVFIIGWVRLGITYHLSSLIHSASTIFDLNADEKYAFESNMVFLVNKSYWLSYHRLAPWDYQTGELGKYGTDCTSKFIRVCAALELATDLRTATSQTIKDALTMVAEQKKPIEECLATAQKSSNIPPDEIFLQPAKYY